MAHAMVPRYVARYMDEPWLVVIFQSNKEIAGDTAKPMALVKYPRYLNVRSVSEAL